MSGIALVQLNPPKDWALFERLCFLLWRDIWNDPYAKMFGRPGQCQHGVDILGNPADRRGETHGVQCKGKRIYNHRQLTENEARTELDALVGLSPPISHLIFATTAPRDSHVQKFIRELSDKSVRSGGPFVSVYGWDDIEHEIQCRPRLYQSYQDTFYPNSNISACQFLFNFWADGIEADKLSHHIGFLPFYSVDIKLHKSFILQLGGYLNTITAYTDKETSSDQMLVGAIENFNQVVHDFLEKFNEETLKCEFEHGYEIFYFWVNVENIPYHHRGALISYKKHVLQCLLYQLMLASNHIVSVANDFGVNRKRIGYVEYVDRYDFCGLPATPKRYPMYDDGVAHYCGFEKIQEFVQSEHKDDIEVISQYLNL